SFATTLSSFLSLHDALPIWQQLAGGEALELEVRLGVTSRDEGRADLAVARLDRQANVLESLLDRLDGRDLQLVDRAQVFLAAELALEDALAVDREDDLVAVLEPALRVGAKLRAGLGRDVQVEDVLAVGGEVVLDEHPASRAERQPVHVDRPVPQIVAVGRAHGVGER